MLARKALGTEGFGYNLVELAPGGALPEHDESGSGQVELYVILDGEEHPIGVVPSPGYQPPGWA